MRGRTIILIEKGKIGEDEFGAPIFREREVEVENVLIGQPTSTEIVDSQNIFGKTAQMMLGIPKGDTHNWEDKKVKFFGQTWKTIGFLMEGQEELIPLSWKGKIAVERYG